MDLDKKNIIVTGASGGIGNSIVERLNEQNSVFSCFVVSRSNSN